MEKRWRLERRVLPPVEKADWIGVINEHLIARIYRTRIFNFIRARFLRASREVIVKCFESVRGDKEDIF